MQNANHLPPNEILRRQIARDTERFLAAGGKIQRIRRGTLGSTAGHFGQNAVSTAKHRKAGAAATASKSPAELSLRTAHRRVRAAGIPCTEERFRNMALNGDGPKPLDRGHRPRFDPVVVDAWVQERLARLAESESVIVGAMANLRKREAAQA
jgi:hypothetical protein